MEKQYWLGRKQAALAMARNAASSRARLVHYDLAGRYSVNAMAATTAAMDLAKSLPQPIYPGNKDPNND